MSIQESYDFIGQSIVAVGKKGNISNVKNLTATGKITSANVKASSISTDTLTVNGVEITGDTGGGGGGGGGYVGGDLTVTGKLHVTGISEFDQDVTTVKDVHAQNMTVMSNMTSANVTASSISTDTLDVNTSAEIAGVLKIYPGSTINVRYDAVQNGQHSFRTVKNGVSDLGTVAAKTFSAVKNSAGEGGNVTATSVDCTTLTVNGVSITGDTGGGGGGGYVGGDLTVTGNLSVTGHTTLASDLTVQTITTTTSMNTPIVYFGSGICNVSYVTGVVPSSPEKVLIGCDTPGHYRVWTWNNGTTNHYNYQENLAYYQAPSGTISTGYVPHWGQHLGPSNATNPSITFTFPTDSKDPGPWTIQISQTENDSCVYYVRREKFPIPSS